MNSVLRTGGSCSNSKSVLISWCGITPRMNRTPRFSAAFSASAISRLTMYWSSK